jgi:serine/threonine protein kinase/Flp pilus assembly protein TadD
MAVGPGTRVGPYGIVSLLGAGGMGEVYRARDERIGRDVAIKVLPAEFAADPDRLRRFEQEARAAGQLNHPNILTVFDVGTHDGAPYIVTELLEGESLRERLAGGAMPVRKAVETAIQIAHGLAAAHEKGVIHRDLKPANVFVTKDGHVKILDFGVAKLIHPEVRVGPYAKTTTSGPTTEAGLVVGTAGYISPEQLRGLPADHRSDIFSFGCVLYETLSGRSPFLKGTGAETVSAILSEGPPPLSGLGRQIPPGLQEIVHRCLEKRPEDRFCAAHDLALALSAVVEARQVGQALVGPADKSVVVIPFENLSPDPENAFFTDGLTEELIADLSKVQTLRVISRTSAMLLKGSKKDVPTIAHDLNVRYVLEGSVRRAGKSLRITAQLIEAASDAHLWAEKYNGTLDDVFAIQEKVSRAIVDALKLTLTAEEEHRLTARMIPDVTAFDLYLRARQESYRLTEGALDHAAQLAREALDIVGSNALLYALLAEIEFFYHDQGIHSDDETLRRAESWADKALALEPDCAAGLSARGIIAARKGDMARAIRDLRRANELQVSSGTLGFLAWTCSEVGKMGEAQRYATEGVAIDPLTWLPRWGYGWVALLDGEFDNALKWARDAAELGGGEPVQIFFLGIFSAYAGRMEEASGFLRQLADAGASGLPTVAAALRALFCREGQTAAELLGNQALRNLATLDKELSWWLAGACAYAGLKDEALHWLSNAVELGLVNHRFLATLDPFLASLRGEPQFEALMEHAREKQRAFEV